MSADFMLIAAPTEDEWISRYRHMQTDLITDPDADQTADELGVFINNSGHRCLTWAALRALQRKMDDLPSIWVGQVSWLGAALTGDVERHVPLAIERVSILADSHLILTPSLATHIVVDVASLPNRSMYRGRSAAGSGLVKPRVLKRWLMENMGCRLIGEFW